MKRIFSCSSSQVAVEKWNRRDQKLLEAVQRGDVSRVTALASRKTACPTKLDSHGQSPFHLAASKGLTECLTVLLANGAEINSKNEEGSTALHLATISCQPQCVKVLLQHGANEDAVDGENRSPLHWAASSGCASSVLLLCDHEAFLDVLDNDGRTPLMIASLGGHAAICSQLLQRGARVNVTDKEDKSALILACEKGSAEVAEMLLSHGADVGAVDCMGHDALYYALRTQDKELWRLLRQALNRRQRGGQGLAQHPDLSSQGSPPKIPRTAEPEEEDGKEEGDEDTCSPQEWKRKYEAERKKVSQLEKELVQKEEECKVQATACQGLESRVREQVQELAVLLAREARDTGGQGPSSRPGGDGMEQGCVLDLLAEQVQELKRQKQAMASQVSKARGPQCEIQGTAQPEEQRLQLQSPVEKTPGKAKEEQLANVEGVVPGRGRGDQVLALKEERGRAPGAEPAGMVALGQLLLQLREELTAVWRDKDAARGVLGRPAGNRVWGASQAEAAAAAWEKMEARLEQVLARLDRAKAGLHVDTAPSVPKSPEEALPRAKTITVATSPPREGKAKEERAHEARGEPLGAPGAGQAPEGTGAKGQLEKEVSALRLSNSNLLEELGELGRERQRLQGELHALSQRLQREYMPRPEAQGQLQQLRSSVGLLAEELAVEKEAAEQLRRRLAAQSTGLQGLRECLPPNLVGGGSPQGSAPDLLEELQGCVGALVARYDEAQRELAKLRRENQLLKGTGRNAGVPRAVPQVAALEQDLGKLEEELRAVQATMGGKSQEIGKLKHLLYQATEEVAELRAREAANLRQQEKSRASLVAQAQTWGQELKALLEKYNNACRETGQLREVVAEERRRSRELAARATEQERQASEMRGRSEQFEKAGELLKEKMDQLIGACREKEAKIRELLKKLEQMSAEVLAVRGENTRLVLQLQDSQKNHQEIISTYRNHLLNAAQGYMEQDVYKILLRILKMQE
ncbi:ankyrin repeat domain-containing protein 35 isoform X2 [Phascolarctos cinereus]|uniref:Ankyrin repeat domain-containing protein 35 isoform X3 n=1 Tax=Phascolarctos cinereus TaxID=38626 RepID=A0A6P5LSX4_PHACI|nr:ankyrin repeat domain-containing protein 35 isoform X3 [Phascolarctos cinereus]